MRYFFPMRIRGISYTNVHMLCESTYNYAFMRHRCVSIGAASS